MDNSSFGFIVLWLSWPSFLLYFEQLFSFDFYHSKPLTFNRFSILRFVEEKLVFYATTLWFYSIEIIHFVKVTHEMQYHHCFGNSEIERDKMNTLSCEPNKSLYSLKQWVVMWILCASWIMQILCQCSRSFHIHRFIVSEIQLFQDEYKDFFQQDLPDPLHLSFLYKRNWPMDLPGKQLSFAWSCQ